MAKEVIVTHTDDLDGSPADETVQFAIDGTDYEIDLNSKNAAALRKAFDRYVASARRTAPARRLKLVRKSDADPKAIRAWAAANGIQISSRGRIPTDVIERYRNA